MTATAPESPEAPPALTQEEQWDRATIDLIFALRDSLTDAGPSLLDFWKGRVTTALATAVARAETGGETVTEAARKLQIPTIAPKHTAVVEAAVQAIDADFDGWARHVDRNLVMIVALADIERQAKKTAKKPADDKPKTEKAPTGQEEMSF